MSGGSVGLLRLLAGGVRPAGAPEPARSPDGGPFDFSAALDAAVRGRLRSGAPVRLPKPLAEGVDDGLRKALSVAADEAAAHGLERVLVTAGNRSFRVDVNARAVIDAPDPGARLVDGIDGLIRADAKDPLASGPAGPGPARVVRNASMLRVLADARDAP